MSSYRPYIGELLEKSGPVLLGKKEELKLALTSLLCNGHLLIEDIPGMGKTTLVYLLSRLLGIELSRIQFTNDLLPSDIIGLNIFEKDRGDFRFVRGPLFGHFILADELNRASPKTQSALLQAMEEREVSIDGVDYSLEAPFLVVATQNPNDQLGTFPLPESQLDRFFMSLSLGFPDREDEKKILQIHSIRERIEEIPMGSGIAEFLKHQHAVLQVHTSDEVMEYLLDLLQLGRQYFDNGLALSPRAGQDALLAAKGWAYIHHRDFVTADDLQQVLISVWAHRLGGQKGRKQGALDVAELLKKVAVDS